MTEVQAPQPITSSMPPEMRASLPSFGKNYMSYSNDIGYDDQRYEDFVTTNYGVFTGSQEIPRSDAIPKSGPGVHNQAANSPAMSRTVASLSGDPTRQPHAGGSMPNHTIPVFPIDNYFSCPLCRQIAISTCGCPFRDSRCGQGHGWFLNQSKMKELGISPNHRQERMPASTPGN